MKTTNVKLADICNISRGVRIAPTKQVEGNVAYIGSSLDNNGIINYIDYKDKVNSNGITVIAQGKYKGKTAYHNYQFVAYDKCLVVTLKLGDISENLYLYLKAYIENIEAKEITLNILNELIIPLPLNNKNEIDIKQIDKFISSLKGNIKFKSLNNNVNVKPLDLNMEEWREYKLEDIFDISGCGGTKLSEMDKREYGRYPFITNQSVNNGVYNTYDSYTEEGNVLVVDSVCYGKVWYIEDNFSTIKGVSKMVAKFKMNKYVGLFISTLLNHTLDGQYNFNRKFSVERIKQTKIKLPTKDDKVDTEYIEKYMKTLKYSNLL